MLIFITAGPICTRGAGATLNFLGAPAPLGPGAATTRLGPPQSGLAQTLIITSQLLLAPPNSLNTGVHCWLRSAAELWPLLVRGRPLPPQKKSG